MDEAGIRRFAPSDAAWLVRQHGELYAREAGFDASFGALVARILDDFIANHDPARERGWIATRGEQRLGSIFCVADGTSRARLRLFLLTPDARGQGLGKRLLATCMGFARDCGYRDMQLSTHESHRAACALYEATGWRLGESRPVRSFGADLVEQSWQIVL
ncbi:N-acetyltransferase family protein [Sedimentitalea sp. XS_ASV28]|uniref:GNAT family N-acetyltransferase n=1 Tax=Sedimentitalea sp. XS_ASV28 TaxID=3241296 RepID=UPI0035145533